MPPPINKNWSFTVIYQTKHGIYHETLWALNAQEAVNKMKDRIINEPSARILSVQEVGCLLMVVDDRIQTK